MKAQFAVIESMLCLFLILSALSFISLKINTTNMEMNNTRESLVESIAAHDILGLIEQNETANDCIAALYATNNSGCAAELAGNLSSIFGLSGVSFAFGNSIHDTNIGCAEVFLKSMNKTEKVCIVESNR
jgi:hypothetical protein